MHVHMLGYIIHDNHLIWFTLNIIRTLHGNIILKLFTKQNILIIESGQTLHCVYMKCYSSERQPNKIQEGNIRTNTQSIRELRIMCKHTFSPILQSQGDLYSYIYSLPNLYSNYILPVKQTRLQCSTQLHQGFI